MIGLIVARSKNNVIGKNGNIPWKIKGEQKQFREIRARKIRRRTKSKNRKCYDWRKKCVR